MSELISKKQAATAFIDGEDVEFLDKTGQWRTMLDNTILKVFLDHTKFRIKPRTITLNGIEVPAPDRIETNPNLHGGWAINIGTEYYMYKSESNYNIVVAALRSVFGKK